MGTDPVDDHDPKSPRSRVLTFLLPPIFAFLLPHVHTVLPLHVHASLPLHIRVPPLLPLLHTPLPGVARVLTPILRALHGGLRIRRRV